jgi:hypothetical protein
MALFKMSKGSKVNLPTTLTEGYCWYTYDDSKFYIDHKDENGILVRKALNAQEAEKLVGYDIATILNSSDIEIPTSKAVLDVLEDISDTVSTNYAETIIGLSVDGTTVTYIKGDGSTHSFETQDTNTTYSLATDTVTGLTKLYATTGSAEDGTMTQKAIKTELDKKVGVSMDTENNTLIFTI